MLDAAAIVLAGGKSSRMGENKALVTVREQQLLARVIDELAKTFSRIIVSANDQAIGSGLNLTTVPDVYPGRGPLSGIHAGLAASDFHANFLVACDMPFINTELASYMVGLAPGYDLVVPQIGPHYQPLFAVYTKNCLPAVEDSLQRGRNKIAAFFGEVRTRLVGPEEIRRFGDPEKLFFNVNTPADLEKANDMAGRE